MRAVTQHCGGVDDVDVMLLLLLLEKNCKDETLQKRRTFAYSHYTSEKGGSGGSRVEVDLDDLEFESPLFVFALLWSELHNKLPQKTN